MPILCPFYLSDILNAGLVTEIFYNVVLLLSKGMSTPLVGYPSGEETPFSKQCTRMTLMRPTIINSCPLCNACAQRQCKKYCSS